MLPGGMGPGRACVRPGWYEALDGLVLLLIPRLGGSGEAKVAEVGSPRNMLKGRFPKALSP